MSGDEDYRRTGYEPPLPLPGTRKSRGKLGYVKRSDRTPEMKEQFAQASRLLPTFHEQAMRVILLEMRVHKEFKEQEVMFGYIADFAHSGFRGSNKPRCYPFIIEVDGATHTSSWSRKNDRYRDGVFNKNGVRVLRITHAAIRNDVRGVKAAVAEWLNEAVDSTHGTKLVLRRTVSGESSGGRSVRSDAGRNSRAGRGTKG